MQDISNYITGLLFIHDCVILPGFGGFVTNYRQAGHDETNHTFTPPGKDVLFNRNLTYNDGLLISYLSRQLKISYHDAEMRVKQSVETAWMKLEKGETLCFEGIGSFSYNHNNVLIFNPEVTENLLTDAYGMVSFRFPPLSYQNKTELITSHNNIRFMTNEGVKKTLRVAAIIIPLAVLVALFPLYRNKIMPQQAGFQLFGDTNIEKPIEETVTALPSDTTVDGVLDQSTNKRVALFYDETPQKQVTKPQETEGYTFYIIGGSFKDELNANKLANQYKNKGFSPVIIQSDNLYRVALSSYTDKVNALHELRRLRSEEQDNNVWLMAKK